MNEQPASRPSKGSFSLAAAGFCRFYAIAILLSVALGCFEHLPLFWEGYTIGAIAASYAATKVGKFGLWALCMATPLIALFSAYAPFRAVAAKFIKRLWRLLWILLLNAVAAFIILPLKREAGIAACALIVYAAAAKKWAAIGKLLARPPSLLIPQTLALSILLALAGLFIRETWESVISGNFGRRAGQSECSAILIADKIAPFELVNTPEGLVALGGWDGKIYLIDWLGGKGIVKTIEMPDRVVPQRAVYDQESGMLFASNYRQNRSPERPSISVIDMKSFEQTNVLKMPGCKDPINVDIDRDAGELIALCEYPASLYRYDLKTLSERGIETLPDASSMMYGLKASMGRIIATSSVFPTIFLGERANSAGGSGRRWRGRYIWAWAMGADFDLGNGDIFLARPLLRRIDAIEGEVLSPERAFRTRGLVRNIRIDQQSRRLYGGDYYGGYLEEFDLEAKKKTREWKIGPGIRGIELLPGGYLAVGSKKGVHIILIGDEGKACSPWEQ